MSGVHRVTEHDDVLTIMAHLASIQDLLNRLGQTPRPICRVCEEEVTYNQGRTKLHHFRLGPHRGHEAELVDRCVNCNEKVGISDDGLLRHASGSLQCGTRSGGFAESRRNQ